MRNFSQIIFLLLIGCATTENFENMLKTWVGASEGELIRKWGIPTNTYTLEATKFIEYYQSRGVYIPPTRPSYNTSVIGNTIYTTPVGGSPGGYIEYECKVTFELQNSIVSSWSYEGNDCKSPPPKD